MSCSAFNSAFVANFESFVFKGEVITRLEIPDLLTNHFTFISASKFSFIKFVIIKSSKIFYSKSSFLVL